VYACTVGITSFRFLGLAIVWRLLVSVTLGDCLRLRLTLVYRPYRADARKRLDVDSHGVLLEPGVAWDGSPASATDLDDLAPVGEFA
jgi:hypothetical protein